MSGNPRLDEIRRDPQEREFMRKGQTQNDPKIYLIWDLTQLAANYIERPQLLGVFLDKEQAGNAVSWLEICKGRIIYLEERRANHIFAMEALGLRRVKQILERKSRGGE